MCDAREFTSIKSRSEVEDMGRNILCDFGPTVPGSLPPVISLGHVLPGGGSDDGIRGIIPVFPNKQIETGGLNDLSKLLVSGAGQRHLLR
jgi:hypothetical protein